MLENFQSISFLKIIYSYLEKRQTEQFIKIKQILYSSIINCFLQFHMSINYILFLFPSCYKLSSIKYQIDFALK